MKRVKVLIPMALPGAYDYEVPEGLALAEGDFVAVPLGPREVSGVVWGAGESDIAAAKLRPVIGRHDCPPMPKVLRDFIDWVAAYTLNTPGSVLRLAMRVREALEPPKPRVAFRKSGQSPERMTPARKRVLEIAEDGLVHTARELSEIAGVGTGVVRGLASAGVLEEVLLPGDAPFPVPEAEGRGVALSGDQAAAAAALGGKVDEGGYSAVLLDGVTGSGKTEVYFEAVAAALARGRQALILVPEIALTHQFLERFSRRFGCPPAVWHSGMTMAERRRTWRAVAEGKAAAVVGARSALFLPYPDLGLIVVDEEHDPAYKQEDGVIYHARDMAVVRASLGSFPIVLASATPSVETIVNVRQGRYERLVLPERHGPSGLPDISVIDMRANPPERGHWLAPGLVAALAETFEAGEQAMLFLNRRGYAPLTLCGTCGHRLACPSCTSWLVEHRFRRQLMCHHCGYTAPLPQVCPECQAEESFRACGPGVERIAEEMATRFPEVRTAILSSDLVASPKAMREIIERMEAGEVDLLIGTQMMAKGHHFPRLTLVGVVDADLGLAGGDLRAAERTFQLLHQVAGRAGRAEHPGRVLLQTYDPTHPVMRALCSGDRDAFLDREIEVREALSMPPFGRLVALILSGPNESEVMGAARALAQAAPLGEGVSVMGPAPAPISRLRGRFRARLLVKAERRVHVQSYMHAWLDPIKLPNAVRLAVDIDPYSFL